MIYSIVTVLIVAVVLIAIIRIAKGGGRNSSPSKKPPDPPTGLTPSPLFESDQPAEEAVIPPPKRGVLPYSVLIVDDQPAIRLLLRELFELEGLTVYEAPHGRMAIEQVQRHAIDFILLDLKMPDMDGIEALREIRRFNGEVMVAMITAYGDPDKLEIARKMGTLAFFTKPFDIEYVKDFVMDRLNGKEGKGGQEGDKRERALS